MKTVKNMILSVFMVSTILIPLSAHAEEGGSGHYTPGGTASFIDTLPTKPGLFVANYFSYYDADASISSPVPSGGLITAGLDARAYADTVAILYQTPLKLLGGYYGVGLIIPYVWVEAKGMVQLTLPGVGTFEVARRDTDNGIGDIMLYPFMIGWNSLNGELKYDIRLGIYTPTGNYEQGKLANVGKNYWTFEPAAAVSYISSRIGLELSAFAGVDFNTENNKTDYQTGTQFHVDLTAAEHLPFRGGVIGVGATGYYYEQITGDSGSGARLGDFHGHTVGIGPVLSYATKIAKRDFAAEVKWLPEVDVRNRLKGDYIWFKLGIAL